MVKTGKNSLRRQIFPTAPKVEVIKEYPHVANFSVYTTIQYGIIPEL